MSRSPSSKSPQDQQLANALIGLEASLTPIIEAVDGHRAAALRRGYGPDAAQQMAVAYHAYLLATLTSGGGK